jgi:nucleoside-diphosphate-sugar epimerase
MRILILGHNGWIGSMVCRLLEKINIDYIVTNVRPEQKSAFEQELIRLKPSHIMSFIGRTHGKIGEKEYTTIDYLEQKGKLVDNVRDNLFSPLIVAMLAKKHNIHYTYLGTGCIFKFDEEHPFGKEINGFHDNDLPNFFGSSYSIVKGYTDQLMHMSLFDDTVLNLRIRMPITSKHEPRNFITKITKYEYICSIPNSMTVLDELLPYMIDMASKGITGTYNFTNPGLISHNEILEMYKEMIDPKFEWKNFSQEEQLKILDADRSNNYLDTCKLQELYPEIKNIRDSVKNVFMNWKMD